MKSKTTPFHLLKKNIETIDELGKNEFEKERKEELLKELGTNIALFAVGGGAGKAGSLAKAALIAKKCPRLVSCITDRGLDFTLSLLGTYALTGQINIEGEGFAQALAIIAGHIKGGKFGRTKISRQDIDPFKNPTFKKTIDNLAQTNPKLYDDFKLLRSKNLLPHTTFSGVMRNTDATFTKEFLDDVATMAHAVRNNIKPIDAFIPKYKTVAEGTAFHKPGQTFSIEGTNDIYVMNSNGAMKLDMTRDMYYELFPPLKTSSSAQGNLGDCYFVGGVLDTSMTNPEAKSLLLSMLHQRGNDIVIDVGGYKNKLAALDKTLLNNIELYDNLPSQIVFKNANKRLSKISNGGVNGAAGLQLIEQAFGYKIAAKGLLNYMIDHGISETDRNKFIKELTEIFTNDKHKCSKEFKSLLSKVYELPTEIFDTGTSKLKAYLMTQIDDINALRTRVAGRGGHAHFVLQSLYNLTDDAYKQVNSIDELLTGGYHKNKNCILTMATEGDPHSELTRFKIAFKIGETGQKQLMSGHQFRIADIDPVDQTISVVNPWDMSELVTISFERYNHYFGGKFDVIDISKTVENSLTPDLLKKVSAAGIAHKAPNGRVYDNSELLNKYLKYNSERSGTELDNFGIHYYEDEEIYKSILDDPRTKKLSEDLKTKGYLVYLASLSKLSENVGVNKACQIFSTALAKSEVIGNTVLERLFATAKQPDSFVYMLEQASLIAPKLRAKGYADNEIITILQNLNKENYPYLKHIWE